MNKGARIGNLHWILTITLLLLSIHFSSADPLTSWTKVSTITNSALIKVIYNNGIFTAISDVTTNRGSINGGISVSTDGSTWTNHPFYNYFTDVAFGNGVTVAVGGDLGTSFDAGLFNYSTNGIDWSQTQAGPPGINGVAYGRGLFVIVGFFYEGGQAFIDTSTNGQGWSAVSISNPNQLRSVAFGNSRFVAVGAPNVGYGTATTASVLTSLFGTNWTTRSASPFTGGLYNVAFVNGLFYAEQVVRSNAVYVSTFFSSTDGASWTKLTSPAPKQWVPSLSTNGLYFYEDSNNIYTSSDATNWIPHNSGIVGTINDLVYGPGFFIAVTDDGSIYRSAPTTPTLTGKPQSDGTLQITFGENLLPSYRLQCSTDLSHWTDLISFTNVQTSTQYLDLTATNTAYQFYRTVSP